MEKGPEPPSDGSTQDARAVLRERRFSNREAWADRHDKPFVPSEFYNLGGKTKWYGAALLRFRRDEELKPYYDEAEALLGVRQFQIEPDTLRQRSANPLEPRRATVECGRVRVAGRRACTSVSFGEGRLAVFIKAGYDLSLPHHEDRRCRPAQKAAGTLMAKAPLPRL